tara:strand:- start:1763 stop:2629 length:867 start_codon:yes stop_codon:yes gene_type:complete
MNEQVAYATMSDREKYLFDLQGFLVVKNFLDTDEIQAFNEAIEANQDKRGEHASGLESPELAGTHKRGHYAGMLTWDKPWCQPFRDILAHRKLVPYLNTFFGRGWKLDHSPDILTATKGAEGLNLHGDGLSSFNGSRYYTHHNGRMRCGLINCQFYLNDVHPGDGGLCVIPGSHKANYSCPQDIRLYQADEEIVYPIPLAAGDLVIFNEATTHGTLPWRGEQERRTLLYRYTPKYMHYVGGHYETSMPDWVSELTEAQQAVLEPPYVYHRPLLEDDGETLVAPRREEE